MIVTPDDFLKMIPKFVTIDQIRDSYFMWLNVRETMMKRAIEEEGEGTVQEYIIWHVHFFSLGIGPMNKSDAFRPGLIAAPLVTMKEKFLH